MSLASLYVFPYFRDLRLSALCNTHTHTERVLRDKNPRGDGRYYIILLSCARSAVCRERRRIKYYIMIYNAIAKRVLTRYMRAVFVPSNIIIIYNV